MMASLLLAFLLIFLYFVLLTATPDKANVINLNECVYTTMEPRAWYSPSRRFAFGFLTQGDGFLVGIWIVDDSHNEMVWTANRDDPPVSSNATIELTGIGLVLKAAGSAGEKLIADPPESVAFASLLDSGNFVLYGQNSSAAVWESFDFPTDTILGGQKLPAGHQLLSKASSDNFSTGRFRLKMQSDGNLVAYPSNTKDVPTEAYWATDTNGYWAGRSQVRLWNGDSYLHLDNAGILQLEDRYNSSIFKQLNEHSTANPPATIYRATLDVDGNFRLYYNTSSDELWKAINGTCKRKNFCGFNSFCTWADYQSRCYCVPGTVNQSQSYNGCRRSFTKQKCKNGKADISFYNITTKTRMKCDDDPYFTARMSEEDCKKSCLEDCNCDAAEYDCNTCNKHKFPLRYISRALQRNSTMFFKVWNTSIESAGNVALAPQPVVRETSKETRLLILVLTSGLAVYSCVALAAFVLFAFKARVIKYKRLLESGTSGIAKELTLRLYSYRELKVATKGFKEELGKGSFGAVYKGIVKNGEKLVAVKRLQKLVEEGEREFQSEMRVIGKTHHKNLVQLLGYCTEGPNRLLVYEFMSNGSLADLLFHSERRPDWHERVRIALDVAKGILYLHEECEAPIIHCDIKPQNILMDEFWNAKVSDFGLAKLLMPDQTRTITDTRGTRGYVAPEWHKNMPISLKVDVYSYGVLLLEIICCRRSIDLRVSRPEEIQLSGWAYNCFAAGELSKLVGSEEVDRKLLERMVTVALWCIQADPILRPSMKGVVLMLEGFTSISLPPCPAG